MEKQIPKICYWNAGNQNCAIEGQLHIPGLTKRRRQNTSEIWPRKCDLAAKWRSTPFWGQSLHFSRWQFSDVSRHRGSAAWPPAFPDLTSCDFSTWDITKDEVNRNQTHVLQTKGQIRVEFSNLNVDLIRLIIISNLSNDRSKASCKTVLPHSAI